MPNCVYTLCIKWWKVIKWAKTYLNAGEHSNIPNIEYLFHPFLVLRVQIWMGRRLKVGIRADCYIYLLHTLWVMFGCVVCFRMIKCVHPDYSWHSLSFSVVWLISLEMHCLILWLGYCTCLFGMFQNTVHAMTVISGDRLNVVYFGFTVW